VVPLFSRKRLSALCLDLYQFSVDVVQFYNTNIDFAVTAIQT